MKTITLPSWLQEIIEVDGTEQGSYSFGRFHDGEVEQVELAGLPKGFVGIASDAQDGGLAVTEPTDGVVYRLQEGEMDTFACDEEEFVLAIRRDIAWEELSENMPASQPFWLGIVLKTKLDDGRIMTLGFRGDARQSALVIRGRMEADDMLSDALNRELKETLGLDDYEVEDLVDEGGTVEVDEMEEPLFTVVVWVEPFEPSEVIQDKLVGWMESGKKTLVN
jgi:hypothetical protein